MNSAPDPSPSRPQPAAHSPYWYAGHLYQGQPLALDPTDPALLYGATVFTTLRVYGPDLQDPRTAWALHCDRLRRSLTFLHWPEPDWGRLVTGAMALIPHGPILRLTLFADGREWILPRPLPPDLAHWQGQGITAWVAPPCYDRSLAGHKTGNYLAPWLARQQAQGQGAQEAILTNGRGEWLETATGTLWGWGAGCWWTPPLDGGILPGVVRSRLLQGLTTQGYGVQQQPWDGTVRSRLTHLAYSNSAVEVVPIRRILCDGEPMNYNPDWALDLAPYESLRQALMP